MKKAIIIFIFTFLLSGCSVNYDLRIRDEINENLITTIDSKNLYESYKNSKMLSLYSDRSKIFYGMTNEEYEKLNFYAIKDLSKNNIYKLKYSYDFNIDNYNDSNAANTCYEYFSVSKEGSNVFILTSNSFNCFASYEELEKVTINITSYYDVVQSNADQINGKKHTWIITPENASNKPIIFVYDESKKNITLIDYITNNAYIAVLLGIFIFIVLPILLFMKLKSKRANKI